MATCPYCAGSGLTKTMKAFNNEEVEVDCGCEKCGGGGSHKSARKGTGIINCDLQLGDKVTVTELVVTHIHPRSDGGCNVEIGRPLADGRVGHFIICPAEIVKSHSGHSTTAPAASPHLGASTPPTKG